LATDCWYLGGHEPTLPIPDPRPLDGLVELVVVDELQRLPLGRPWLTLAIDVASRMVTGFYVSLDAPSTLSVPLALTQAVLPKDLWLCDPRTGRWLGLRAASLLPAVRARTHASGHETP
jgi:hypothetical protein